MEVNETRSATHNSKRSKVVRNKVEKTWFHHVLINCLLDRKTLSLNFHFHFILISL